MFILRVCSLRVTGKQLPPVTLTLPTSRSSNSNTPADLSHLEEEIIEQNGDMEEILAIDNGSVSHSYGFSLSIGKGDVTSAKIRDVNGYPLMSQMGAAGDASRPGVLQIFAPIFVSAP